MKTKYAMRFQGIFALAVLTSFSSPSLAAEGKSAPSNIPDREFPLIHSDLRVTFRVKAPDAKKVQFAPRGDDPGLGLGPFDIQRESNGIWNVTTAPMLPGFHYYELVIDGFRANDPNSETFFGWGQFTSGLGLFRVTGVATPGCNLSSP